MTDRRWIRWTVVITGIVLTLLIITGASLYCLAIYDFRKNGVLPGTMSFDSVSLNPNPRIIFNYREGHDAERIAWCLWPFRGMYME